MTHLALLTAHANVLLMVLVCAAGISLLVVLTKRHHGHLTLDSDLGVQKFHVHPTPRVGVLGIYLGVALAWAVVRSPAARQVLGVMLVAGLPALIFGLLEDVTKRVSVRARLLATFGSGLLACWLSGIALSRVDVPWIDGLFAVPLVGVLFTAFAISGIANAINIIDGFHGLASGTTLIALLALAAICVRAGDIPLALVCLFLAAAVAGFWLVNYPWGKIFLGDGGAYFVGFAVAWIAILLPMRNPEVSVWSGLVVCAYPVIEVLYSVARRAMGNVSPGAPDNRHLHSLLKTEVIRHFWPQGDKAFQNAAVAPVVWCFVLVPALLGVAFYNQSGWLALTLLACTLMYHGAYQFLASGRLHFRAAEPLTVI